MSSINSELELPVPHYALVYGNMQSDMPERKGFELIYGNTPDETLKSNRMDLNWGKICTCREDPLFINITPFGSHIGMDNTCVQERIKFVKEMRTSVMEHQHRTCMVQLGMSLNA
ncbi:hypothetical protein O181_010265 [Austropuccinia psidii MF-1]|uniref:Uncharacterized protein n=1 Tax=Austropuccinia psidii MF-1 TaxID=1389203 RepID=A0A9Q3BTJ0_9BASI|nr:hypothetical protein [Austropuccinia psidii MF-1]